MNKSKRTKGRNKSDPEQIYLQEGHRAHTAKAWRERNRTEREAAKAAEKERASKRRR